MERGLAEEAGDFTFVHGFVHDLDPVAHCAEVRGEIAEGVVCFGAQVDDGDFFRGRFDEVACFFVGDERGHAVGDYVLEVGVCEDAFGLEDVFGE